MLTNRIVLVLAGALAASTLAVGPAPADELVAPTDQTAPTAQPDPPRFRNSCRPQVATLPAGVEGKPATFAPGAPKGLYVWHTRKGWRVRLTHPGGRTAAGTPNLIEVRGRIAASRPIVKVRTVQFEDRQAGEWVAVQRPKRTVMDFRFVNGGFIDGINFGAGCAGRLTFTVWEVTRDATTGAVTRTPIPVLLGAQAAPLTSSSVPARQATPVDATRFLVLRTPPA